MKISLTIICGNVAQYMRRFFVNFADKVDEIVVVRAIGNQEPDESLDIAKEFGAITAEYKNCHAAKDWPHVDNFAAARNMAAMMATGDWLLWLDTDDVLGEGDFSKVRELLEHCDKMNLPGLMLPYRVPEDGVQVMRERFWKKEAAIWEGDVHECLHFHTADKTNLGECKDVIILHAPESVRTVNNDRNLRILESIPEDLRTIGQRFHLFMTLRSVNRMDEACQTALSLVQEPEDQLASPERYELLIALGQLSHSISTRHQFFLQAVSAAPDRREAYGELALMELNQCRFERMRAWLDAMHGLPKTPPSVWNIRQRYWSWLGVGLKAMALRGQGEHIKADALEYNHFIEHGAKITLCHATRGRLRQATECRKKWLDRASNADAVEHIFAFDADDEQSHVLQVFRHVVCPPGQGSVAAWNAAAAVANGEIIVQLSDDWDPPHGWDKMIIDAIGDTSTPKVLAIGDGYRTDALMCMAICTKARLRDQGYFFHPDFTSVYSDNWFSHCAWRDGVVIDARDTIVFQHNHPAFEKGHWDAIYANSNSEGNYQRGKIHYDRLVAGHITSHDVHGWCNYRAFYTSLASHLPQDAVFVEIGSWMGQSIIHLAQRCQDLGKRVNIHVVDTFQGEQDQQAHVDIVNSHGGSILDVFKANIKVAGVDHMITIHVGDSAESAAQFEDGTVDACYVDAAHEYGPVIRDLHAWIPKMKPAGIFSGHDYQHEPVRRAVDETMAAHGWDVAINGNVWIRTIPEVKA
jgi:hypothetical protein